MVHLPWQRLKLPTHTDKTQLKSTVDKAQALKAEDYTPENWKAVQTALEQAVAVLGENNSTQEQVTLKHKHCRVQWIL